MFHRARFALTTLVLLCLASVGIARAQTSWAVAERDDASIQKLVTNLQGFTETLPGGAEAPAVVLYRQLTADSQDKVSKACVNMIVEVRDPAGVPDDLLAPYLWWSEGKPTTRASFVLRGGEIERKGEGELSGAREKIGVERLAFDWGELQKGDVIGWSVVMEEEGPFFSLVAPMAERVPMVISNITTRGNDKFAYRARWFGMEPSALDIKELEPRDSRPMSLKVSANQRPAMPDREIVPPFTDGTPYVMVVLDEVFFESKQQGVRSGWIATGGWNQNASGLAGQIHQLAEKTKGLDIALSAITTGKRTAHEKAAAITDNVRTKFTLLDGPDVDDSGMRDLSEVFKAKEGTRLELIMLAAVMMRQSGVPVTAALLREPKYGALDESWASPVQFTNALLRVEADGETRFYAPQCAACEPGSYPAEWAGTRMLVWNSDLFDVAKSEGEAMQKRAMAEGNIDPAAFQAEIAKKSWSRFETLGN